MIRVTGTSRNTLKEHFRAMIKKKYLNKHGRGRGTWYSLKT